MGTCGGQTGRPGSSGRVTETETEGTRQQDETIASHQTQISKMSSSSSWLFLLQLPRVSARTTTIATVPPPRPPPRHATFDRRDRLAYRRQRSRVPYRQQRYSGLKRHYLRVSCCEKRKINGGRTESENFAVKRAVGPTENRVGGRRGRSLHEYCSTRSTRRRVMRYQVQIVFRSVYHFVTSSRSRLRPDHHSHSLSPSLPFPLFTPSSLVSPPTASSHAR